MAERQQFDTVIIGGGHNGLACAVYLARGGQKVCVLERRHVVGGAAATEEFHSGFSGTLRMNVALKELPEFTCLPTGGRPGRHQSASILIAPSLPYLKRACDGARQLGWTREPAIEMHIPSIIDDSLALPGQHFASLFCQQFSPELPINENGGARSWEDEREAAAETVIDTITRYAPNFRDAILGKMVLTPLDLEQKLGLTGGDIFHGQLRLDQLFSARPMLGYADYRMSLDGLYLCGSGAHPGGGVTGIPGHNAAREMLRDMRCGKLPTRRRAAA